MTRISPQTFTGATTGAFVPVETHAALARAGIPTVTLDEVVGPEGRLDQAEARELFAKLRRREDGGANRTLDRASPQGRAAEELMDAIRTARA